MTFRILFKADRLLGEAANQGPILGLDTSGPTASIGLINQGRIVGQATRTVSSHCEELPAMVAELLGTSGRRFSDLAAIAVAIGPGSFTGLRISLSYAKGIAVAAGCAVVGVPTLDSIAICAPEPPEPAPGRQLLVPILDARREEVYAAVYRQNQAGGLEKQTADLVLKVTDLPRFVNGEVIFIGPGVATYKHLLQATFADRATFFDQVPEDRESTGAAVAVLGAALLATGQFGKESVMALQPQYVRPPEAHVRAARAPSNTPYE